MVNTLRGDPQTSEEEHFKLMLVQTEMERVKYLVRSYVRTRLHKVCRFPSYLTCPLSFHSLSLYLSISRAITKREKMLCVVELGLMDMTGEIR